MLAPRLDRGTKAGMREKPVMKAGRRACKGKDGNEENDEVTDRPQDRLDRPRDEERGFSE